MSDYQVYRDLTEFAIVKDGQSDWKGKYKLTPSGFGFEAEDCNGTDYFLDSRGMFFWRKLKLYRNGEQIDRFTPYRSHQHEVSLKRGSDIFIEGREVFSFLCKRELTASGNRIASWDFPSSSYDATVYSLILLWEQGRDQMFG